MFTCGEVYGHHSSRREPVRRQGHLQNVDYKGKSKNKKNEVEREREREERREVGTNRYFVYIYIYILVGDIGTILPKLSFILSIQNTKHINIKQSENKKG